VELRPGGMALTLLNSLRYDTHMASEITPASGSTILDLTGLPEPVVKSIKQLVQSLREGISSEGHSAATSPRPPLRGRFADLRLSIPKEDLDEAQRETWQDFPRAFPEPGQE
jgi:hypothetical protein